MSCVHRAPGEHGRHYRGFYSPERWLAPSESGNHARRDGSWRPHAPLLGTGRLVRAQGWQRCPSGCHGLISGVAWTFPPDGRPGVERDEQVEALLLEDLAHDDPGGPHPQRLLDQPAQLDLAGAPEAGLAALHGDDVGQQLDAGRTK